MARMTLRQLLDHAAEHDCGGPMRQTFGLPIEQIMRGIKHSVRKGNIESDCRLERTGELRRVATTKPDEFDPRKFLKPAKERMRDLYHLRFEQFIAAGQAGENQSATHVGNGQALCVGRVRSALEGQERRGMIRS